VFWVVNPANIGQLVPIGAPGELLIEGPQLARGYLNDPVKTAAAFIQDPPFVEALGLSPARRMYRTGDIVQQNADRSLSYLGRRDTQVKIRGQRVEVGEIEYHLGNQAGIHDAIVIYMRKGPLAGQLIAAVIISENENPAASGHQNSGVKYIPESQKESAQILLRKAQHDLSQQVMHYMVPSIWIPLAAVPINASGKTDRLALTRWVQSLPPDEIVALTSSTEETEDAEKLMATATPVERSLREIWSEVLCIPLQDVTYSTTFFSLGGDSITAMQVVSASRARGVHVTVRSILDSQTIPKLAAQAQRIEAADCTKTPSSTSMEIPTEERANAARTTTATAFPLAHLTDSDMLVIEGQYLSCLGLSSITEIEDILPCSPIQQGILLTQLQFQQGILLTQLQSPSTYCIQHTCRIKSSDPANITVSVDRLVGAWRRVVMRHSILRTVFLEPLPGQERFIQVVLRQPDIVILVEDGVADTAVSEWFDSQPILDVSDLRHPPHRLTLLRTATGEVYCRLDVSHALVDASSLTLTMRDFITAYEGTLPAGGGSHYSAYIEFLEGRQPQEDLQFWKESLRHAEPCLLPPQGPLHNSKEGKIENVSLRVEDLTTLHRFRDTYGVSIASICQLAWTLVLASQIGSQNISFGNLSSGRDVPIPGVEKLVGPMINMLVCHTQLDWSARVSDVARRLQSQFADVFEHQRTSLASIQHELGFSRDQPLFNSTLSYKRQPLGGSGQSAIILEGLTWEDPTEYDLNVNIDAAPTELAIHIQYYTSVFSNAAATKLGQRMVRAVYAICENAGRPLGQLSLLSPEDGAMFCRWNSAMPKRLERCVHDLVLDKMAEQPEKLAISAWDGEMTYAEVDEASRRLAYHLVERGVGPNVMVGMCMDKSKLGAVAMVAILRAGGAVVPLGVQQPLARIQSIMQDAATPLVLVDHVHEQRLAPLRVHAQFLAIDSFFKAPPSTLAPKSSVEPCITVRPDHVAWVIYTSGSTGKPKGVVLQHGSLATSIFFHGRRLDIHSHDRLLQFAAFTFDAAIQEIITAFAFGACTCLPSEEDRMDRLTAYLSEANVTIATLTSTVAALVRPQDAPTVRTMILMGEAVQAKVVDQWIGYADVINAYGPSECCIHSTCQKIPDTSLALNIGTAIAGGTWVVNPASIGQLVPLGAPGELLIEGPLLARGYLHDPVKTAAAFIEDPAFVEELGLSPGRRMYRTGDLVRQNPNGSLTYLGRIDAQVKIRGQRVEVGEIEYHIGKQAGIHDAVVLYMRHGPLSGQLIAAVILSETSVASRHQNAAIKPIPEEHKEGAQRLLCKAQEDLSQQVMHYMVPNIWLPLAAAPINASGKTDRMALTRWIQSLPPDEIAALTRTEEMEDDNLPATATAIERSLREIWSEVLGVPLRNITYSAKFFGLGGDSITAMQVVSASRARGILITVRKVLESQTIPKLAAQSQTHKDTGDASRVPDGVFALSPIQQMYFDQIAPGGLRTEGEYRFNQAVSLHITKRVELPELAWALDEAVVKHAMLRARFRHSQGHGWQQWIERELTGSYRLSSHTAADAKSIQHIIAQSQGSLNLEHGPVFAAALIELQDRQVLHLVAHHLVIDLVSWRILIRDLEELLEHRKLPNPSSLSFPVWLERQYQSLSRFVSEIGTPAEASVADTLPVAVPSANWEYWGLTPGQNVWGSLASIQTKLDSNTTSLLYKSANAALNTEPVEILLAALFLSFRAVFTDRPVPAVFTEGHGREAADDETDLSDTIGWFTTMTPLHVPVGAYSDGSVDVLRQVKDQRRRIPGRGVPYFGSRFLTPRGREEFEGHGPAEILFNYTGRFQQTEREETLFRIDDGDYSTSDVGGMVKTFAVLDVTVTVEADEVCISLRFSRQIQQQAAVREWLQAYGNALKSLVNELVTVAPRATATDFPLARLSDSDMGAIEGQYLNTMGLSSTSYIEDILPCSPIQQGILLTQVQSPSTYCIQQTCHIKPSDPANPVSMERLVRAWHHVVSRHSILRTILLEPLPGQERFIQVVLKQPDISILSEVNIPDRAVAEWFDSLPILDLSDLHRPPHRLTVLRTAAGEVYCRLDVSHTLVDASSLTLIIRDLISAYEGALPAGGSNYSAYVAFLEGRQPQDDLEFWKILLSDAQPCLLEPQEPPHNNEHQQAKLAKVFTQIEDLIVLHHFRDTYGVSIASICQLAWALVLATRTGSNNVSFGNLSSGRDAPIPGVKDLVGPMINLLVCHLQLDWDTTVSDIARKLQSQSADAFEHQRTSLASIQHELGFSRTQPLFNSTLSYKRQPLASSKQASIILEGLSWEDPTEYDLNVNINTTPTKLEIDLQYSTAVFSDTAAGQLAQGLVHAIHAVCENANRPLRQLSLLSSQDKAQLSAWNSIMPRRVERCLHELVLDQIAAQPTAPAVCAWDGELTYGELDGASHRLAHHLARRGVGPEAKVGVCMNKSKWTIVAMLAILRAGGAVVPLGVGHPLARIAGIVQDIAAPLVLVDCDHEQRLDGLSAQTQLLAVESFFKSAPSTPTPSGEPCTSVRPHNVAWVIFTSGSTGKPKGVVLEHGGLVTSILAHAPLWGLSPSTRTLQFAAFTFDVSISDIMATLAFGGCICSPSEDDRLSRLNQSAGDFRVTYANVTPTVARLLDPKLVPTLKTLVLIGEAVDAGVVDKWNKDAAVINGYGPAEASIVFHCSPPILDPAVAANVGHPIAGGAWVANPDDIGRLVPLGAPGELLIEGPLLSRGYLNDPIKTAVAFVTDPAFVQELGLGTGRRMYRTGDLVRQNTDGSLTFIGRRDTQVKVRGQRVEVGEVESEIVRLLSAATHAYVSKKGQSLVGIIESTSRDRHTSRAPVPSIILPDREQQKAFDSLRTSLLETLPRYMIPSAFLAISKFPLNDSGKLDRRAVGILLDSIPSDKWLEYTARSQIYQAPVGPKEQLLCELWATCIGLENNLVSRTDNFFDLGGDSMTAMTLVQQLRGHSMRLSVIDMFNFPVLSDMAACATVDTDEVADYKPLSLVSPKERSSVLECVRVENAQDVLDILPTTDFQVQIIRENLGPERRQLNYFAFDASGPCYISGLTSAVSELVMKFESLRTGFARTSDQKFLQVVYAKWQPEVRVFHTDMDLDAFCRDSLDQDMFATPSLARPMFDVAIVIASTNRHRIVFRISHALYDGATLHRVWTTLEKIIAGQPTGVSVPVGSYFRSLQARTTRATEDYWRELLRGANIPSISAHTDPQVSRLGLISGEPIVLGSRSGQAGFPVALAVKAAWGIVLGLHTSSRDVVFADIYTGRNTVHPSAAGAVACCARAVPCRVAYEPEWTLEKLLEQLKKQQVDSMRHEGLEFQTIAQRWMGWSESQAADLRASMVNHLKASKENLTLGDTVYKRVDVRPTQPYASVDFALETVEEEDESLSMGIAFAADRIPDQLARTLLDRFRDTLKTILGNRQCSVSHLIERMTGPAARS
jgi:amino acid adenylation domain-containing protein/non-ribosomal peptide synthase protein (TIGR01720 family)